MASLQLTMVTTFLPFLIDSNLVHCLAMIQLCNVRKVSFATPAAHSIALSCCADYS